MKPIKAATYEVVFKEDGYQKLNDLLAKNKYSSIFILVDTNTFTHCYPKFIPNLETNTSIEVIEIDAGEEFKTLDTCIGVWQALTELGADRKSLLLTLGGGVITDLGGFVAAAYKRGIDFVNIPTTLLSMVDASVGGKTGVDLDGLKNQIGVFANPEMVIVDDTYLKTLEKREFTSGLAEILKYGLTHDQNLFETIKNKDFGDLQTIIYKSIAIKNEVVLEDPKEKYLRKVLNFGHTIGHAVETFYLENDEKETLLHGEAIAIGMICESYISSKKLNLSTKVLDFIKESILLHFNKIEINKKDYQNIINNLKHDKKNIGGNINFVLLNGIEDFKIDCLVEEQLIMESLDYYNE